MGACNFIEFGKGKSAQDAFDVLVSQAEWDYGHDPYNGTISTTRLMRGWSTVADEWNEDARELAIGLAEVADWGNKWESRAIDCGECGGGMHMWAFYGWAAC